MVQNYLIINLKEIFYRVIWTVIIRSVFYYCYI